MVFLCIINLICVSLVGTTGSIMRIYSEKKKRKRPVLRTGAVYPVSINQAFPMSH